ncbi:hypothetical protein HDV00_009769 [Rhizophlyctis rosea]|nr:hypothetical protein HDV00_009769 [Rhizophlyctis rosea]
MSTSSEDLSSVYHGYLKARCRQLGLSTEGDATRLRSCINMHIQLNQRSVLHLMIASRKLGLPVQNLTKAELVTGLIAHFCTAEEFLPHPALKTWMMPAQEPLRALPPEIIRHIARLAEPAPCRRLRNACKGTRVLITESDVVWAEAGWRHFVRGIDNCWDWATRHWHTTILRLYASEVTMPKLCDSVQQAVRKLDLDTLKEFVQAGAFLDATALDLAAEVGSLEIANFLKETIENSGFYDAPGLDSLWKNVVEIAVEEGNTDIQESFSTVLLQDPANSNFVIRCAAETGLTELVRSALANSPTVGSLYYSAVRKATNNHHEEVAKLLLDPIHLVPNHANLVLYTAAAFGFRTFV